MPNIENLKKVRDFIANEPEELFAMERFFVLKDCGTARCIGGTAAYLAGEQPDDLFGSMLEVEKKARDYLGMTFQETEHMFYGWWMPNRETIDLESISRKDALAYLDAVIETDNVFVEWE